MAIRLREESEEHLGAIDPNSPTGRIAVLVLSSDTFDASEVDVSSIRFGPGKAAPISSLRFSGMHCDQTPVMTREQLRPVHSKFREILVMTRWELSAAATQVALVRQAIVIDNGGKLVPSALTESLQLRVYGAITPGPQYINSPDGIKVWLQQRARVPKLDKLTRLASAYPNG